MLLGLIIVIVYIAILFVLGLLLLNLLVGAMKLVCTFTKPVFAMFMGWLFTSGSDGVFVQSPFWDWLLLSALIYAVIFVLCGFPRVNRAFDAFTSMILVFLLAALVGGVLMAISSSIFGEFGLYRFWKEHYMLVCLALSLAGPFITNYLQRNYTTDRTEKVGSFTESGLFHCDTYEVYETTVTGHDLSRHFFSFGDRWPVFQRLLAAFVYALYPGIILMNRFTKLWDLGADFRGWAVCIVTLGVLTAAAYFVQVLLERRKAAAGSEEEADDFAPEDVFDDFDLADTPAPAEFAAD